MELIVIAIAVGLLVVTGLLYLLVARLEPKS